MNPNYSITHPEAEEGGATWHPPRLSWAERKVKRPLRQQRHKRRSKRVGGVNPWYPGAVHRPGRNAGYAAGRNSVQGAIAHYTVGRDSTAIGDRGYFHFLVRRNGEIVQFAECDAVTWHACEWNRSKCGIEVEYYEPVDGDVILTREAEHSLAGLLQWLEEFGFPIDPFNDGNHTQNVGNGHTGTTTHRDLKENSCDWHYDWWPEEAFIRMRGGAAPEPEPAPPPPPKGAPEMFMESSAEDPAYMILWSPTTYELMFPQEYMRHASSGMPHAEGVGRWVMDARKQGRKQVGLDSGLVTSKLKDVDREGLRTQLSALTE